MPTRSEAARKLAAMARSCSLLAEPACSTFPYSAAWVASSLVADFGSLAAAAANSASCSPSVVAAMASREMGRPCYFTASQVAA